MTDQPSDGAMKAAGIIDDTRELCSTPYGLQEMAETIDREAVAPAVRDYDGAIAGLLDILQNVMPDTYWVSDSRCQLARHCREQYRHLLNTESE